MNYRLKITRIGNSLGVILPKEVAAALKMTQGDTIILSQAPGGVRLTPYDPEIAHQLEAGRKIAKQYRDTLRALAK